MLHRPKLRLMPLPKPIAGLESSGSTPGGWGHLSTSHLEQGCTPDQKSVRKRNKTTAGNQQHPLQTQ